MFIIYICTLLMLPQAKAFDFFQFVLQYQTAVCAQSSCSVTPSAVFTIHGLWPSNYKGRDPTGAKAKVDRTKLTAMEPQLAPIWPNLLVTSTNMGFWGHEWIAHGSVSQLSQDAYFQKCINLAKNNVTSLLEKAGIRPERKKRTAAELETAINGTTKKQPTLRCYGSTQILYEVILCFDNAGASPVDCPPRQE